MRFFGRGVYPELYQILRYAQNDKRQRPQDDKKRKAQGQGDKRGIWVVRGWQLGQK